ncbi:MAG: MGMT family protein [Phycisphaerales bacterium]
MNYEQEYSIFETKWGYFGLAADRKGLLKASLPIENYQAAKTYLLQGVSKDAKKVEILYPQLTKAIIDYYNGTCVNFKNLKYTFNWENLTDFSIRVLTACKNLEIGQTATYGQLAAMAGYPGAARAVGSVMAANRWPLIVGCHRIIRSDGQIGNFSFCGSETKKRMLELEKQMIKGVDHDSNKENRIAKCTGGNRALLTGNQNRKFGVPFRSVGN